jgi:hypothetical protein
MRTYLTVVDDTPEAEIALRFAARRAAKTGGTVLVLALIEPAEFVAWGAIQATMEEEARQRAAGLVAGASGTLFDESGIRPSILVRQGEPVEVIRDVLSEEDGIAALVLGAAATGAPGPLVAHFAGAEVGGMPCPVMVIPGSLTPEAVDRLS